MLLCVVVSMIVVTLGQDQGYTCPEGWNLYEEGKTCLKTHDDSKNWNDARAVCKADGGDLAKIADTGMNNFIKGQITECERHWIGLHDTDKDGKFQWLDEQQQSPFEYWHCRQPNNIRRHHCVEIVGSKDGRWDNGHCSKKRSFICQKDAERVIPKDLPTLLSCDFENEIKPFCLYMNSNDYPFKVQRVPYNGIHHDADNHRNGHVIVPMGEKNGTLGSYGVVSIFIEKVTKVSCLSIYMRFVTNDYSLSFFGEHYIWKPFLTTNRWYNMGAELKPTDNNQTAAVFVSGTDIVLDKFQFAESDCDTAFGP